MSAVILSNLSDIKPNIIESVNTTQEISDIVRKSLIYLIGYIFQRLYTKLQSFKNSCKCSQQCLENNLFYFIFLVINARVELNVSF